MSVLNPTALPQPEAPPQPEVRERIAGAFYLIWFGQFVSMMGTHLTGFALGVWLFQRTGSVLDFAQLTLFATLPALLLMPWSASLADRWDRRRILIACEAIAMACTVGMGLLLWFERFEVWQLMALQAVLSVSLAFQGPAAFAIITTLVPKQQFTKAGGMFQMANAVAQFSGPLLAGALLGMIGIVGIVGIDAVSFSIALLALVIARFPALSAQGASAPIQPRRDALADIEWAFNFVVERPSMALLYAFTTAGSFLSGIVVVLISPLVLSFHTEQELSWVLTAGAGGVFLSGVLLMAWGGPKRFRPVMLGLNTVQGLAIACAGLFNSVVALAACAFVATCCSSMLAGYVSTVWRRKVPRERHGSFGALQQAVALALVPLAAVIGGTLAHYVFEPALLPGGFLFDSVGAWFGTGKGRGTGLLFFVIGISAACNASKPRSKMPSERMRSAPALALALPLAASLLAACSVGPVYQAPTPAAPARFSAPLP
jgi:DHA3 family macrolide efflux protein-like MFS transporter